MFNMHFEFSLIFQNIIYYSITYFYNYCKYNFCIFKSLSMGKGRRAGNLLFVGYKVKYYLIRLHISKSIFKNIIDILRRATEFVV